MDGPFYNDLREPHVVADLAAVTLSTTAKALYGVKDFPYLPPNYFGRLGKKMRIRAGGKITTAATPGNGSFNIYWGNGTDANGTLLMTGTPVALTAAQTNLSWFLEFAVRCTALGSSGALEVFGIAHFHVGVIASTLQPILLPASAAAPVSVDLTVANIISLQYLRSGSTVETMAVQDLEVVAMN